MSRLHEVPADISRSWMLVPGTAPDSFDRAAASRADQIILDVEDAVDPKLKPQAIEDVATWLEKGGSAWVRINDYTTDFWKADLERLRGIPGLRGVMLAKTEWANQVTETFELLDRKSVV